MEPIKTIRVSERVIDAIKEMILEHNFAPGDRFYSEHELKEKLQVSRASIREAVRIMEVTGQVTVKHGKGIFISNYMEQGLEVFAGWLKNNETSLLEHFEIRLIIDPKAAAYAAEKADADDIKNIEEICEDFILNAEDKNIVGLIKADEKFHLLLSKSTKNKTLYFLMKTMTNSLPEGWISSLHIPGRVNKTIQEHKAVLDAIKDGNSDKAESAMITHLKNALNDIKASINGQWPILKP